MKVDQQQLQAVLAKVAEGDEAAFAQLFDWYRSNIYTTALRIAKDGWVAEEILQDVFVKVWLARTTLNTIENFDGWLYTIARNITYNALKRSQKEKEHFNKVAQESISLFYPEADYQLQDKEFQRILEQAIERLPEKQQATYRLIKEQHLKRDQAAAELGVSPETVKWNLDQAMRSVRAYCVAHIKDLPLILILHFYSKYF